MICLVNLVKWLNTRKCFNNYYTITGAIGETLDEHRCYKYLGIWEQPSDVVHDQNKVIIREKIIDRTKQLCKSKLSARYLMQAINEFALSTANYHLGIVDFTIRELEIIGHKIKQILYEKKFLMRAANVNRLYLPRSELGRELQSLGNRADIVMTALLNVITSDDERAEIGKVESQFATTLSSIRDIVSEKYNLPSTEHDIDQLKQAQITKRLEHTATKSMHNMIFTMDGQQ